MTGFMHNIVDETQATFIKDGFILDNILIANEIIYFVKCNKHKGILLKADFEKTYDRVSWSFIKELLLSRGFGPIWTNWIMNLLLGVKTTSISMVG
jgi:hypothetical protein